MKWLKFIGPIFIVFALFSCSNKELENVEPQKSGFEEPDLSSMTQLGKRLENPYSV